MTRRTSLLLVALLWAAAGDVAAQVPVRDHVQRAASRFGLSPELVEAVVAAESGGEVRAVSKAGAMGLMQLMPGTWMELRRRLALGPDPFDPADNVLAGTAYLRQLLDRYGSPGFLAAYNAGPGRYEQSLAGRALPAETVRYVEKLSSNITSPVVAADWRTAGLFTPAWQASLGRPTGDEQTPTHPPSTGPFVERSGAFR